MDRGSFKSESCVSNVMNGQIGQLLLEIFDKLYSAYGPQHWWPGDTELEIIVGAILTQNTNWGNVEKAIDELKRRKLLSIDALLSLSDGELAKLIRPVGYYNIKAKRLKSLLSKLHVLGDDVYKMDTFALREELLSVNGIGKETADSIILYAFNRPLFVVDTYTKRIFSRVGVVSENSSYDEIQNLFMSNLPVDVKLYNEYHALIVRHAKSTCLKKVLKCEICVLRERCLYGSAL